MGKSTRWLLALIGLKKSSKKSSVEEQDVRKSSKDKRRWSFGKSAAAPADFAKPSSSSAREMDHSQNEQAKHAIAIAAASAAAAEAAVAAAHAAAAVVRLTGAANYASPVFELISREEWAAIKIQTAFRGYLARRALRALKAVVRIQALFRGHRVRKQAAITLRCMQALVRVQARVRARRVRMSKEGQAVQQQLLERRGRYRKSMDGWIASTGTVEDFHAKNERKHLGAMKRERALAYAFSQSNQLTKFLAELQSRTASPMVIDCEPDTPHWGWSWLERWMAARPWENPFEATSPVDSGCTKIVEVDYNNQSTNKLNPAKAPPPPPLSSTPPSSNTAIAKPAKKRSGSASESIPDAHKIVIPSPTNPAPPISTDRHGLSPNAQNLLSHPSPVIDHHHHADQSSSAAAIAASPKDLLALDDCFAKNTLKPLKNAAAAGAGTSAENQSFVQDFQQGIIRDMDLTLAGSSSELPAAAVPSYMATTQSSKAKVRSHSTPKQRPEQLLGLTMPDTPRKSMRNSMNGGHLLLAATTASGSFSSATAAANNAGSIAGALLRRGGSASSSQHGNGRGFSTGSMALDRSLISFKDGHASLSINGDMRKPFRF
ncbi:hypothetical protein SELMODRAFT_424291 [Selaginella moellendorffii]|uniref:DUF4005 domain-containing protein n=1 Tax=Selaginella moellendorffii TaxID=88036 RepID=D8SPE9_SELML|nr:protein IQ-DOMAIN 1 isoform X1 [Selaginella moellendorffii]EFJ13656.1 hypothetical protein SELMODRAFT_424291 [Selaginella moellendorffii]|eukprot:XP_002985162.1 protein IQ-DOMAIN 1 isoform X1 [Selaginella moellendorffii]